jgi:tetratricopeptide (TPR) repeat protein
MKRRNGAAPADRTIPGRSDAAGTPPPGRRRPWQVGLLLLLIAGSGFAIYRQLTAMTEQQRAIDEIARNDDRAALTRLKAILLKSPDNAEAAFWAARAARHLNDFDSAEHYLGIAERRGWVENAILLERNLLRARRGDFAATEAFLLNAVYLDHPDTGEIVPVLARIYLDNFNVPMADRMSEIWILKAPTSAKPYLLRSEMATRLRDNKKCLENAEKAFAVEPENPDVRIALGKALGDQGNVDAAIVHLNWLRERQIRDLEAYIYFVRILEMRDRIDEGAELLRSILRDYPNEPLYWQVLAMMGRFEMAYDRYPSAYDYLKKAYQFAPFEREVNSELGKCLQKLGRTDEAKDFIAKALEIEEGLRRMEDLSRQISLQPNDPELRYEAGTILLKNGQHLGALQWFNTALQQDPYHRKTHLALADYYRAKGFLSRADEHRRLAETKAPTKN